MYTHTHTYAHTHMHAHTCTHTHARTHMHTHTHTHICTHTHARTHMHTHTHMHTQGLLRHVIEHQPEDPMAYFHEEIAKIKKEVEEDNVRHLPAIMAAMCSWHQLHMPHL